MSERQVGAWWRGARRGARCRHAVFCPRRLGRGRSRELRPCPPTGCVAALAQGSGSVGRVRGGSHPAVRLSRARALGLAWASRLRRERRYFAGVRTDPCTQTRTHGGDRTRGGASRDACRGVPCEGCAPGPAGGRATGLATPRSLGCSSAPVPAPGAFAEAVRQERAAAGLALDAWPLALS